MAKTLKFIPSRSSNCRRGESESRPSYPGDVAAHDNNPAHFCCNQTARGGFAQNHLRFHISTFHGSRELRLWLTFMVPRGGRIRTSLTPWYSLLLLLGSMFVATIRVPLRQVYQFMNGPHKGGSHPNKFITKLYVFAQV